MFALLASPAFAGNLTIYSTGNTTSSTFVNTRANLTVFNFSVRAQDTDVTVSAINITLANVTSSASGGNISKVFVFNGSTGTNPVGTNSSLVNVTPATGIASVIVNFTTLINITKGNATTFIVQFEIHTNATSGINIGGNLSSAADVFANTSVFANVSLPNSTVSTVVSVHANASISPRIVDTGVENQSFIYTITPTGQDRINRTVINLPSGYTLTRLAGIEVGGSNSTDLSLNATGSNQINVTTAAASGTSSTIKVHFDANTSANPVSSSAFTSTVSGNLSSVDTDAILLNQTNVTAMGIINLTTVAISKGAAIVNGSDYWEFNMTFQFNASATGLLHFRMSNWTSQSNSTITLNHSSCAPAPTCATLRTNINASLNTSKINITNTYDPNYGIPLTTTIGNLTTMYLRMVIPTGTVIASTWSSTYFALFRATP